MKNNENLQQFVSKRIRTLRKEQKLSQEKLSEMAGLGIKYIHNIENKEYGIQIDTLEKIIKALEITPSEFFNFDSPQQSSQIRELIINIEKIPKSKQDEIILALNTLLKNMK